MEILLILMKKLINFTKPFFLLSFLIVFSCSKDEGKEVFFINHPLFYSLNTENSRITKLAEKQFRKKGYRISKIQVDKFDNAGREIRNLLEVKNDFIIFAEPFISPLLVNWNNELSLENLLLVTYGSNNSIKKSKVPLFNISYENNLISEKLSNIIKKRTDPQNESIVLLSSDSDFDKFFEQQNSDDKIIEYVHFIKIYSNSDSANITRHIEEKKIKNIFMYSNVYNRVLNNVSDSLLKNIYVLEVNTNYGLSNKNINSFIYADYKKIIREALNSEDFENISELLDKDKVYNYISVSPRNIKLKNYFIFRNESLRHP